MQVFYNLYFSCKVLLLLSFMLASFDVKSINNEQDVEVNKKIKSKTRDISHLMSKSVFMSYQDVADFIEHSPKVTVIVPAAAQDKAEYGNNVMKSLTGTDCDRDGKMDDNKTCNAVYLKLWLKYGR